MYVCLERHFLRFEAAYEYFIKTFDTEDLKKYTDILLLNSPTSCHLCIPAEEILGLHDMNK